ncbi:MAG: nuclear transport factor 2 family protein [Rhodanobacter sp.]
MRTSVFVATLFCAAAFPTTRLHAGEATPALRDQLVATTQAWVDAIPRGDKAVWQNALTDDAIIIDEFGRIQHKKDAIESLHAFPPELSGSIELRDAHALQDGDTAILQVEQYERETVFGQKLVVRYQSLMSFVKRGAVWKLAGAMDVTIPTAPPTLKVAGLVVADYVGSFRYAPASAWTMQVKNGVLGYTTRPGRPFNPLDPIARDVFMETGDERNLLIFRRDAGGHVVEMIERRKFNDLHLKRDADRPKT